MNTPGHIGVDFEMRVDFDRLRSYRLDRARKALEASEFGALLLFDFYNIRYVTSTWIGGALGDKMSRYWLLTRDHEPIIWTLVLRRDTINCSRPGLSPTTAAPGCWDCAGRLPRGPASSRRRSRRLSRFSPTTVSPANPLALTSLSCPSSSRCRRRALTFATPSRRCSTATDQVPGRNHAALPGGRHGRRVYQDIFEALKPGVRENEIVALANKRLYEMGSDQVEAINAVSGERCNPHPHNFTDRIIRPGDQAFFDIIHSFNGYRTCYYRTLGVGSSTAPQRDAYVQAREWMDQAIDLVAPGVGTDVIAKAWPARDRIRLRQRDGGLRTAVRSRTWSGSARATGHQSTEQPGRSH